MVVVDIMGWLPSIMSMIPDPLGLYQQQASLIWLEFGIFLCIILVNL